MKHNPGPARQAAKSDDSIPPPPDADPDPPTVELDDGCQANYLVGR